MSPERLNNAPRSTANNTRIWSIGATYVLVQMIYGQQLNHLDTFPQIVLNILVQQNKIFINGILYFEFLQSLSDDEYKNQLITRTI